MELKQTETETENENADSFNRTFMELKPFTGGAHHEIYSVLIGPSWN